MTVQEIVIALIGIPGRVEVEIVDSDGIAAELLGIKVTQSNGATYVEALIDEKIMLPDGEEA